MNNMLLKAFGCLPSKIIDSINLIYNRVVFRKNIKKNIAVWRRHKTKLTGPAAKSFRSFAVYESSVDKYKDYLEGYISEDFRLVKGDLDAFAKNKSLIMMCAVKDDLYRIKYQYKKMKQYGIRSFVYIDNGSTDGTREWLAKKDDIVLYSTTQRFNSTIKSAWYRRVVESIGFNRWYLYLDSDEVYMYPGIEKDKFQEFLKYLETKQMFAVNSVLLDMYPKDPISIHLSDKMMHLEEYRYFDPTYKVRNFRICKVFYGGPRYRVFSDGGHEFVHWLNKANLVYYKSEFFQYAHYLVPHSLNFRAKVFGATAHYKFLPNDFGKFIRIAEKGDYANNSAEYKRYMEVLKNTKDLSLYCKDSVYLGTSNALERINLLDKKLMYQVRNHK